MDVRRYRARKFGDALAEVERDLGPDAVILSSREIGPRVFPLGRREVEITAAPPQAALASPTVGADSPTPAMQLMEPIRGELRALRDAVTRSGPAAPAPDDTDPLARQLARQMTPPSAIDTIARRVRATLGRRPATLSEAAGPLAAALEAEMIFAGPIASPPRGPRIVAVVGPTGVGKTTTVAKIAARAALVERRKVALVSVDRYRVAGIEQLARYADLIGLPLEVADGPASLRDVVGRASDADLVLVDTAGRAPGDTDAVDELARTLAAAGEPVETHLLLSATTREAEAGSLVRRHSACRPSRLTITKVDEALAFGGIVSLHARSGLPLAYFTTGQRVPEDIEPAASDRLAALLCGIEVN